MPKKLYILAAFFCFCKVTSYAQIDTTIGLSAPGKHGTDVNALASFLTIDLKTEREKANVIYNWVTHNIRYDVEALKNFPKYRENEVAHALKTRKAVCEGYSQVFTELCKAAGMKSVTVEGYAKDWIFDNGDEMYIPRHQWSAVKINGKWHLADPTWGAGVLTQSPGFWRRLINKITRKHTMVGKNLKFKFKYDTAYFLQNPEEFRLKHLPSDPLWQLTDTLMPLAVFEAGDSAVKAFNTFSKPRQDDPRLDKIATLDEKQKIYESADRAYAYNKRFPAILALKNTYRAEAVVMKAITDSTVQSGDLMLKDAVNDLKLSLDYIKQQKKAFPEEYNKLKKKNKAKTQDAKQHMRQVRTDDKRLLAQCNRYSKTISSKNTRVKRKIAGVRKNMAEVRPGKIAGIAPAKIKKREGSPELEVIKDSLSARQARINTLTSTITHFADTIQSTIMGSKAILDTLIISLDKEDSMLRQEAIQRLSMRDSYDDEVKMWDALFKKQKYHSTDTILKNYFSIFDTVTRRYEQMQAKQTECAGLYKQNLKAIEQYRKWNTTDTVIYNSYAATATVYRSMLDTALQGYSNYVSYLNGNDKLFGLLGKLCKRQIAIVDFMQKAEESRQALEDKSIAKKKAFDIRENGNQKNAIQKSLKQLQDVVKQLE